jgi:hypothetical protein
MCAAKHAGMVNQQYSKVWAGKLASEAQQAWLAGPARIVAGPDPFDDALQIYERHRGVFDGLAYSVVRTSLTREKALQNWQQMKVDPQPASAAQGSKVASVGK